jgi:hypothetical protein
MSAPTLPLATASPRISGRTRPAGTRKPPPLVPPQHGAWGFLGLPLVLSVAICGWSLDLVLLGLAWVAAYPASWAICGLLTARRPGRFRQAAMLWSSLCAAAGLPLLWRQPWLAWVLLGYLGLFAINLALAWARRERSMTNDLVLIVECALFVPVAVGVAGEGGDLGATFDRMSTSAVLVTALLCALTLVGSTLHVKSLIRERRNPRYTWASRFFALASPFVVAGIAAAAGEPWWLSLPFVFLAARALFLHNPAWRPARIGMIELAGLVLVALTVVVAGSTGAVTA